MTKAKRFLFYVSPAAVITTVRVKSHMCFVILLWVDLDVNALAPLAGR